MPRRFSKCQILAAQALDANLVRNRRSGATYAGPIVIDVLEQIGCVRVTSPHPMFLDIRIPAQAQTRGGN